MTFRTHVAWQTFQHNTMHGVLRDIAALASSIAVLSRSLWGVLVAAAQICGPDVLQFPRPDYVEEICVIELRGLGLKPPQPFSFVFQILHKFLLLLFHFFSLRAQLCDLSCQGSVLPSAFAKSVGIGARLCDDDLGPNWAVHGRGAAANAAATLSTRGRRPASLDPRATPGGTGSCEVSARLEPASPRDSCWTSGSGGSPGCAAGRQGLRRRFTGMVLLPGKHGVNVSKVGTS